MDIVFNVFKQSWFVVTKKALGVLTWWVRETTVAPGAGDSNFSASVTAAGRRL